MKSMVTRVGTPEGRSPSWACRGARVAGAALAGLLAANSLDAWSAQSLTARARLEQVSAVAKQWRADAALKRVGTTVAKQDGSAAVWQYDFQSQSTRSCLRVVLLATGASNSTDLGKCTLATPVDTGFVDSAAAFGGAVAGGFKPGESNNMYLSHTVDRSLTQPRYCWVLFTPSNDFDRSKAVMRGWCVDPKSGKFVTRLAGQH